MFKWIAGGVAAFLSLNYLSRLQKAGNTITSRVRVRIHKVNLTGIELRASVQLQNPNPVTLNIQHPFLKVLFEDKLLGSSQVENRIITVPENSQQNFELQILSAGWLTLIQLLGTRIVGAIRSGDPIQLNVQTQIISRINGLPYEKTEDLILQF